MSTIPQPPAPRSAPHALLASVWQRNLPLVLGRVASLSTAAEMAATGELTPSLRQEAAGTAHKLAGSLGMFGYPRGSEIAQEIERMLEQDEALVLSHLLELTLELSLVLRPGL